MKRFLCSLPVLASTCLPGAQSGWAATRTPTLPAFAPAIPLVAPPGPTSFAPLVRKVVPAVVNIAVTRDSDSGKHKKLPTAVKGTPLERRLRERIRRHGDEILGAGSGFILDPSGIIVTNGHVVDDADKITVSLMDGKEFTAELVGIDKLTDIAVIKIQSPSPLPYLEWGDSRLVQVGDWIVAAGNPFGLGSSITAGIVSARGRDIGTGPFDDFLQLDAPINPGNSGGPTFNLAGQVIALNTAIVSPTGGSVGLGFSIPSELVIPVVEALRHNGHIERGWLGATLEDIITHNGARVAEVDRNGPAAKGGMKKDDIIIAMGGEHMDSARSTIRAVAAARPNTDIQVTVQRQKAPIDLTIHVGHRPRSED